MNTDHDEEYNRLHWEPTECSPEPESMYNSPPEPSRQLLYRFVPELGIELPVGSMNIGATAFAKTTGRGTYR
jgi:hypothetical protein